MAAVPALRGIPGGAGTVIDADAVCRDAAAVFLRDHLGRESPAFCAWFEFTPGPSSSPDIAPTFCSAIAPALLYLLHPCSRRQLLLHCSRLWAPASLSALAPASLYLLHPWSRTSPI